MTVRGALALPSLRRGLPEVVAGARGLDEPLRWAHAAEVPHIAALLHGGELLLTTGMGLGRTPDVQRQLVADLAARDVAALVVELGDRVPELPEALVDAAEAHGLPLVALRREIRFVEVTEAVQSALLNLELAVLRRSERAQQRFTDILLAGGGLTELLPALAAAVENPVVVEDADGRLLAHARHRAGDDAVFAAWERIAAVPEDTLTVRVPPDGRARLVALALEGPLGVSERAILERAADAVALGLARAPNDDAALNREHGDLLADLVGDAADPEELAARAWLMGFRHRGPLLALAAVAPSAAGRQRDDARAAVWHDLRAALATGDFPVLVGRTRDDARALVIAGVEAQGDRSVLADACLAAIREAEDRLDAARTSVVAVGPIATDWVQLRIALRDAADAAIAASDAPTDRWVDAARPSVDRLLWRLREAPELRRFADAVLEPLLAHDARRPSPLQQTLEQFLRHGGRKAETARALHLERQSLYHRLARLEQILGVDLNDEHARLALQIALRAHRYGAAMRADDPRPRRAPSGR